MVIKAIFFDAAGTLIRPVRRVGESYSGIAKKYGMEVPPAQISERFRVCFDSAPPLAFPDATAANIAFLERDWWRQLMRRIFEPWGHFERFDDCFTELFAYFARPDAWGLYPEVSETLSLLKEQELILDVISNFDSRLPTILDGLGVAHWFDWIFISSRVGHAKPAREIFEAALNRHGLAAESAVHVGDSEEKDLRGANNAGLKGVLVNRNGENKPASEPSVSTLKDLLSLLEN